MDEEPPLQVHAFTFGNDITLEVECRKTLTQTVNFKLTVQCDHEDIWRSLEGFGGCFPESDDEEQSPPDTAASPANAQESDEDREKPDLLGLDVWPAALELCTYLATNPSLVAGAAVLELGAGVGLPGLLAARLGASRVVLTDYEPQVVAHVTRNATLCKVPDIATGFCLDWTKLDHLPAEHAAAYPILLAADVLYIADIMPGFVDAVCALLQKPGGVAIIGHQTRRALVLDETRTPMMVDDDIAFGTFRELCSKAGLKIKELGRRQSPGFPGPLIMFALAREEAEMDGLPPAFVVAQAPTAEMA